MSSLPESYKNASSQQHGSANERSLYEQIEDLVVSRQHSRISQPHESSDSEQHIRNRRGIVDRESSVRSLRPIRLRQTMNGQRPRPRSIFLKVSKRMCPRRNQKMEEHGGDEN